MIKKELCKAAMTAILAILMCAATATAQEQEVDADKKEDVVHARIISLSYNTEIRIANASRGDRNFSFTQEDLDETDVNDMKADIRNLYKGDRFCFVSAEDNNTMSLKYTQKRSLSYEVKFIDYVNTNEDGRCTLDDDPVEWYELKSDKDTDLFDFMQIGVNHKKDQRATNFSEYGAELFVNRDDMRIAENNQINVERIGTKAGSPGCSNFQVYLLTNTRDLFVKGNMVDEFRTENIMDSFSLKKGDIQNAYTKAGVTGEVINQLMVGVKCISSNEKTIAIDVLRVLLETNQDGIPLNIDNTPINLDGVNRWGNHESQESE